MSSSGDSGAPSPAVPETAHHLLTYAERIEHFAAGYSNSQSLAQFLDTKASAVVGAVPVVLALLAGLFAWLHDWSQWDSVTVTIGIWATVVSWSIVALIAAWLLTAAILAITAAFKAISPHDGGDARPSLIFPFATPTVSASTEDPSEVEFKARAAFFVDRASQRDALEDYRRQTVRMSQIVAEKLKHVNKAVRHLQRFFVAAVVLAVILLLLATGSACVSTYAASDSAVTATQELQENRP